MPNPFLYYNYIPKKKKVLLHARGASRTKGGREDDQVTGKKIEGRRDNNSVMGKKIEGGRDDD